MKETLFPTISVRLSERSTFAKIESNVNVEVKAENDINDEGDDERAWPSLLLFLAGGGGGLVEVSNFLRLGVLIIMLLP